MCIGCRQQLLQPSNLLFQLLHLSRIRSGCRDGRVRDHRREGCEWSVRPRSLLGNVTSFQFADEVLLRAKKRSQWILTAGGDDGLQNASWLVGAESLFSWVRLWNRARRTPFRAQRAEWLGLLPVLEELEQKRKKKGYPRPSCFPDSFDCGGVDRRAIRAFEKQHPQCQVMYKC